MPSNETALILSAIEDLREDGRARDAKLDKLIGLKERVDGLETKVNRHQYGGILVALLMAAGIFGENAKNALLKLIGVH